MFCKKCRVEEKSNMAGQGFTRFQCEKCGQIGFWHNTNTPKYCLSCTEENLICGYCGKDLIVEILEELKGTMSLYEIALEIGTSESSLYKYLNTGKIGPRVHKKLRKFVERYIEERGY